MKCTEFAKYSEFFACDKLDSPSLEKNKSSVMFVLCREESDLLQQDFRAKEISD